MSSITNLPGLRVDAENPNHHLWDNHGTWFLHYTVHPTPFTKERVRRSLGTRRECAEDDSVPEGVDPRPSAEALLDQKRLRMILDRVLDTLTDDLRVSFVLYELEGMSSPEIAELLRIPVGTVASRLRRGREAFEVEVGRVKAKLSLKGGE